MTMVGSFAVLQQRLSAFVCAFKRFGIECKSLSRFREVLRPEVRQGLGLQNDSSGNAGLMGCAGIRFKSPLFSVVVPERTPKSSTNRSALAKLRHIYTIDPKS